MLGDVTNHSGGGIGFFDKNEKIRFRRKLFSHPLLQLGPFTLENLVVMKPAVLVLQQSLKPGRYKDYLQWDNTKSYSEAYGNIWSAGVLVIGSAIMVGTDRKMMVTTNPIRGTCFETSVRGTRNEP